MTVICPSCEARFRDPPAEVSKSRPLQCGKCEHEWIPVHTDVPRINVESASIAPDMADLVGDANEIRSNLPVVMPKTDESDKTKPIFVDSLPGTPKIKTPARGMYMTGLACLMAVTSLVVFKDNVMTMLPKSHPIYMAAGLTSANKDLQIENVTTTKTSKDGIKQLIVRGEIQNMANATVPVPPIKLIMRGDSQSNLYAWTVTATKENLKSGERSRFTAVAHDFPDKAVDVAVEFASIKNKSVKPRSGEDKSSKANISSLKR